MKEHDIVALTEDVSDHKLRAGDVGAIVYGSEGCSEFEVEFVAADGSTIALLTLSASQIRPVEAANIIPHERVDVV